MYKNQHYRSPQNDCFDLFFFLAKKCYIMLSRNNMLIFFGDAYFDESVSFFFF